MIKLVCLDRDGTINYDDNYYLGSFYDWKKQVRILEGVVEGIKNLNDLPKTQVFIVTNQRGVAIQEPKSKSFSLDRMHEVNQYIIDLLGDNGAKIHGYFACPFVDLNYQKNAEKKGWKLNPEYVKDGHPDLKPNIGMLEKCTSSLGCSLREVDLYVIGDRISDVELGLNGGGKGILVISQKTIETGEVCKVRTLQEISPGKVFISDNFLDAVRYTQE